jgi:hypothetical protein
MGYLRNEFVNVKTIQYPADLGTLTFEVIRKIQQMG